MPQPTPYDRITNFQNDQALHPTEPYPAPLVDAEYNAIKITTDEILQNLALIQRDDGQLANDSVGFDQLRDEIFIGFNPPRPWETDFDYIVGDTVFQENSFWFCLVSHHSTDFSLDYAAGYWTLIADFADAATIGAAMYVSDNPPVTPTQGQQWYESDTGNTFLWYIEPGDTLGQWVHINGEAGVAPPPADGPFVLKAGDTMSGDLQISKIAPALYLNRQDGNAGGVRFRAGTTDRWLIAGDDGDFAISRYDDAGAFLGAALSIARATAVTTLAGSLNVAGNGTVDGILSASTTLQVGGLTKALGGLQVTGDATFTGNTNPAGSYGGRQGIGGVVTQPFNIAWTGAPELWIGTTYVGTITVTSDYRIKKDVVDLPSTWDTVKALRPIKYTQAQFSPPSHIAYAAEQKTKDEPAVGPLFEADDIERWGFIAHELQETLTPSAATGVKDQPDAVQALNLAPVVAALTKALQEAMARIEALEAKG